MELWPYKSGFNGQVILKSKLGEERFEFSMHPSTEERLYASGAIFLVESEAWRLLESLSVALKLAGFPHQVGMDDRNGNVHHEIEHEMPTSRYET